MTDKTAANGLRWKRCEFNDPSFVLVISGVGFKLQQCWFRIDGSPEWLDVPFNFDEEAKQ